MIGPKAVPTLVNLGTALRSGELKGFVEGGAAGLGTIQNTTSVAVLERFVQQFPASRYSDFARARLEELEKSQTSEQTAPPSPPVSVSAREQQQPEPAYQNDTP